MRFSKTLLSGLVVAVCVSPAFAIDTGAAPPAKVSPPTKIAPTTRPVDEKVLALIEKLGDGDPTVREEATKKLQEMGKAVLANLQEAAQSDDPEVRSRARGLIRKAERRLPPAAPARDARFGRSSVRMSSTNGERTVDADDNGYRVKIRQGPAGIKLDVTGVEDGKEVTESYSAKDADELKKENPEAFALYDKYNNGNAGFGIHHVAQIQIKVGGMPPGVVGLDQGAVFDALRMKIEAQLDQANMPAEQKKAILDRLDQHRQQIQPPALTPLEEDRKKAIDDLKEPLVEKGSPEKEKADSKKPDEPEKDKTKLNETPPAVEKK